MCSYTRREFAKIALAALPAAGLLAVPRSLRAAETLAKPDSKFAGVEVGLNVPYSLGEPRMSGADILKHCVQLGFSALELRAQPVEVFLGAPAELVYPATRVATAAQIAALRKWREAAVAGRAEEFRQTYHSAGVAIGIMKVDGIFGFSDGELDYVFQLAKALGADAISTEISKTKHKEDDLARLGRFATKHRLRVGYHAHTATGPEDWERAFALSEYNCANLDIGHYVAGNHGSPMDFIRTHHDRITHIHIKDRKKNDGPATPFGEGDTPIIEVLRLLRDEKWPIQATIEFEYKVPAGSDRMTEIARALAYCREALVA